MPVVVRVQHVFGELQRDAHRIAVVVVPDVLSPIDEARPVLTRVSEVPLVHVHHLVAAVDLDHRRDERDQVVPDRLDVLVIVDDEAIGELHQRRGRARFRRVNRAGDVVDGRRLLHERLRLRVVHVDRARVAEFRQTLAVLLELRHDLVGRNRHGDHLAPFFGPADRVHLHALRRRFLQHAHVLIDLFGVRKPAGRTGDVAEHRLRRRNRLRRRQIVDERRREERLGGVLLDLRGVLLIDRNLRIADERLLRDER